MRLKTWLRRNFVAGLLVLFPIVVAVAVFWWLVRITTSFGFARLQEAWPYFNELLAEHGLVYTIIGRAFVLIVLIGLVALVGAFTRNVLGVRVVRVWERVLLRIPLFNRIYSMLRQLSHAIWGQSATVFSRVVLVEYPRKGLYSLGFVTSYPKGELQEKTQQEVITVFIPTAPNPTSGFFIVAPRAEVIPLSMSVEDGFKMVISAGAVMPEEEARRLAEAEAERKAMEARSAKIPSGKPA